MNGIVLIGPVVLIILESPIWLYKKGKFEKFKNTMLKISKRNGTKFSEDEFLQFFVEKKSDIEILKEAEIKTIERKKEKGEDEKGTLARFLEKE